MDEEVVDDDDIQPVVEDDEDPPPELVEPDIDPEVGASGSLNSKLEEQC